MHDCYGAQCGFVGLKAAGNIHNCQPMKPNGSHYKPWPKDVVETINNSLQSPPQIMQRL